MLYSLHDHSMQAKMSVIKNVLPSEERFSRFCSLPLKLLVGFHLPFQEEAKSFLGDHLCIDRGIVLANPLSPFYPQHNRNILT